jgi:hypothetical protein
MSKDEPDNPSSLTEVIVTELLNRSEGSLTRGQVAPFVNAVVQGLEVVAQQAVVDENRLAHLETVIHNLEAAAAKPIVDDDRVTQLEKQTHVLAEAIIALNETTDSLAPAVQAVKDEMKP